MKNKKLIELIKYEVEKFIISKWFIILNIILLVGCLAFTNLSEITKYKDMFTSNIYIDIIDNDNLIYKDLVTAFSKEEVTITKIEEFTYDKENIKSNVVTLEVIPSNENGINVKITTLKELDEEYYNKIEKVVIENRNKLLVDKIGVTEDKIEFIMSEPVINEEVVGLDVKNLETKTTIQFISAYANLILLFLLMSRIQTQFMQEKVSKMSEYILTNINEKTYLLLKTFTVVITFVIQVVLLLSYYMVGTIINQLINIGTLNIDNSAILSVDMSIVKMIAIQLILSISSIFIQCLIQAAISSKAGNPKEGTNVMTILIIINFAIYMYTTNYGIVINLSSNINNVLSVIPIVSTYMLPVMLTYNSANTIQIILAILFDLLLIPIVIKKCSKAVKNGVLGYDSKGDKNEG